MTHYPASRCDGGTVPGESIPARPVARAGPSAPRHRHLRVTADPAVPARDRNRAMSPAVVAMMLTGAGALAALLWKREVRRRACRGTSEPIGRARANRPGAACASTPRNGRTTQTAEGRTTPNNRDPRRRRRLAAGHGLCLCTAVVRHDEPQYPMRGGEICSACCARIAGRTIPSTRGPPMGMTPQTSAPAVQPTLRDRFRNSRPVGVS